MSPTKTYEQLVAENEQLRIQLEEATETIHAIRTGQVDALVVHGEDGHELYTLKTADQTYRVFIETMHEGAVTLNEQGLVLYGNSMFASIVGLPLAKVIGTAFSTFITSNCQERYATFFQESWRSSSKSEMTLTQDGGQVACLLSATPLALDEGHCLSIILTDLTAQKETQQLLRSNNDRLVQLNSALETSNYALNRSNDNLQQFAYVASHDLQEPLRKIQQFSNLLKASYETELGQEGIDFVNRMESAAVRMSALIRDLLTYSRLTIPTEAFQLQNLDRIVSDVLGVLELIIQETGATIHVSPLGQIPGDASQLAQVFQNLLTNSIKFMKAGELPVIHFSRQNVTRSELPESFQIPNGSEQFCLIQVIDNGIGFDAHQAERIFGTFQRLHGRGQYPGTGIGLAIVRKVVENHRGFVMAQSQPDQGATFSLYLPI
ncbi:sensor histidine kinase [Spirosoma validum]|uniref:histidine kinase n=1 Tax=Spirosoma validum TaxID=2771355 RepID=A0A927B5I8_9BACT|nr:ATP-binding protein [Spirosoma validum]MBD2755641.1 PAS domain S-box protein [Spirosoma validum]